MGAGGVDGRSMFQVLDQAARIDPQRTGHVEELHYVKPTLSPLDFQSERLRATQLLREPPASGWPRLAPSQQRAELALRVRLRLVADINLTLSTWRVCDWQATVGPAAVPG